MGGGGGDWLAGSELLMLKLAEAPARYGALAGTGGEEEMALNRKQVGTNITKSVQNSL